MCLAHFPFPVLLSINLEHKILGHFDKQSVRLELRDFVLFTLRTDLNKNMCIFTLFRKLCSC